MMYLQISWGLAKMQILMQQVGARLRLLISNRHAGTPRLLV